MITLTTDSVWLPLAEGQSPRRYDSGQLIYIQGTDALQFHYIISGTVKCFISSANGDERTLTLHHTGDLIGEASFFDRQPRVSSAMAMTPCTLITIDRPHLERVFSLHPDLAINMLEYLARTIRLLSTHVDGTFLRADQRIARHLFSHPVAADGLIRCTHEEVGSSVGVSRVTVSRVLGELEKQGVLETGYRTVKILDYAALEHIINNV